MPSSNLSNANANWYIILYDLFSRLWYIATCGPFCKDATHICLLSRKKCPNNQTKYHIVCSELTSRRERSLLHMIYRI